MAASVLARLFRHEKDHRAGVARRIARVADLANFPFSPDLQRYFLHIASTDIGERDNRDLAARLRSHILGDPLHTLHRIRRQHVRKIVHQARWGRDLNSL